MLKVIGKKKIILNILKYRHTNSRVFVIILASWVTVINSHINLVNYLKVFET